MNQDQSDKRVNQFVWSVAKLAFWCFLGLMAYQVVGLTLAWTFEPYVVPHD